MVMNTTAQVLPYVQLVLAILLILVIVFQRSGEGIEGGALGGTSSNITHFARRGGEKVLFFAAIIIAILFAVSAIVSILF